MAESGAEKTGVWREVAEHAGQVMAQLGAGEIVTVLAVPGGQSVRLAEGFAKGIGSARPARGVERNQRTTPGAPVAVMSQGNARCLIAQNDPCESTNAATTGVEGGKSADQVDQQILTQIIEIGGWPAKISCIWSCFLRNAHELG